MAKYSKSELKDMAEIVCEDSRRGGFNSMRLFMTIATITGLTPNKVRQKVQAMADEDITE